MKREARKQLLIAEPPPILTLHLKRFEQLGAPREPHVCTVAPFARRGGAHTRIGSALKCPNAGMRLSKVTKHVDFPLVLDLAPFCTSKCVPGGQGMGSV